jgi:iron complex transport system substrate-binding protein
MSTCGLERRPATAASATPTPRGAPDASGATGLRLAARSGLIIVAAVFLVVSSFRADAQRLPRVMSTDLCGDLLLVSLGAPEQILSLSRVSRDPRLSSIAEIALDYPTNAGGVEDLLYRQPDVALVYLGWTGGRFHRLLARQDIELASIPYPSTWEDAVATAREIAAKIGRVEAGEAIVADAERRMRALTGSLPPLRALYLRPGGGSAGTGTYVDDVLRRLGLRNVAAEAGRAGWGGFPLEAIVTEPPDLFVLGYFDEPQPLSGSSYARHPLLREALARTPAVHVPTPVWGCGGLELIDAAEAIAARVRGLPSPAGGDE